MNPARDDEGAVNRVEGAPAPRSSRRTVTWLLGLGVVAVVGGLAFVRLRGAPAAGAPAGSSTPGEARPVPVVVATAAKRDVPIYLEGLGNATPLATVVVRTQVDGRLDKVFYTEGQSVKKGDVLAQIDPRPFAIALRQAEAAIARDTATAQNAKRNLDRYQNLVGQKLIAQQQVDDQQMMHDQAMAALASDRTVAENARLQLDYAKIKSPIDGVTGVRLVDAGNIVHPSDATGIVVVTQLDPMGVVFTLPEDDLPRVSRELASGPLTVEAYSRDAQKRLAVGKLLVVDNQVSQATATIKLKAVFPNAERFLWPNGFLKTRLLLTTKPGALVVPAQAIQRGPKGTFVYVVDAANKAVTRFVMLEATEDEIAVIASGIEAGERVIIEGQSQLRPGATVAPRAPATEATPEKPGATGASP
jgi:multidrug efflux system membrane fusion protein